MIRAILFDLDGTLVDTRNASWELFSETNEAFALGIDSREDFFRTFEGNFFDSLAALIPDRERADAAKTHFLTLLRQRYNPTWIPGMAGLVRRLAKQHTLAIVSTNALETIHRILSAVDLDQCFPHVFAGDVEPRKAVSIARFVSEKAFAADPPGGRAGQAAFDRSEVVLVTDTVGDVREARDVGVRAIGVDWGMHTGKQLLGAGAALVVSRPEDIESWLTAQADAPRLTN